MTQPASIVAAFSPLLPQLTEQEALLLVAVVERLAAQKYRGWAAGAADPVEREGLLACAAREDEIAAFIESLDPEATARTADMQRRFPDLSARYDAVMQGRSRAEQLRIQAEGELGGAGFMRQFASNTHGAVAARFAALAACEEANSAFLSALLGA